MALSRYRLYEERRQKYRIYGALFGSVCLLLFVIFFGFKLLVNFSLIVDKLRGNTPQALLQTVILPPVLDPLPEASNSASQTISGRGTAGYSIVLYVNETETKRIIVPTSGEFDISQVNLKEGLNIISTRQSDDKGNISDLSNVITTNIKNKPPHLEVTSPEEGSILTSDNNYINITGKTDEGSTITVNDRFVVVNKNGTFTILVSINEGNNSFTVTATDVAGNKTSVERHVVYQK